MVELEQRVRELAGRLDTVRAQSSAEHEELHAKLMSLDGTCQGECLDVELIHCTRF